jgi:hypothetical protein
VPRKSRHLALDLKTARAALIERGADPAKVSLACVIGNHEECKRAGGKIMLRSVRGGAPRYARCHCPDCKHPAPRTRRMRIA